MCYRTMNRNRRGAIVPLAALLLIFFIGMVAFAVDVGWIVVSQTNLQNAADSAALAGAQPLMNGYVQYNLTSNSANKTTLVTSTLATCRTNAINYASYNSAGKTSSLVLNSSDIVFGFTNASGTFSTTYSGMPNTIQVTVRLDSQANGSLGLFFAPVLGTSTTSLTATARATVYTATLDGLSPTMSTAMLPIAFDTNYWSSFMSTLQTADGTTYTDSNGVAQNQIYPSIKAPGNFGQLSLDDQHEGNSVEVSWVNYGVSATDIQSLIDNNLIPLSNHASTSFDWSGDTGMKTSLINTINSNAGDTTLLPLFTPYNSDPNNYSAGVGQGSNYNFSIVQFVGVKIMAQPSGQSGVWVQPAAIVVPNAVFVSGSITPAGTSSSVVTTFTAPKLTN